MNNLISFCFLFFRCYYWLASCHSFPPFSFAVSHALAVSGAICPHPLDSIVLCACSHLCCVFVCVCFFLYSCIAFNLNSYDPVLFSVLILWPCVMLNYVYCLCCAALSLSLSRSVLSIIVETFYTLCLPNDTPMFMFDQTTFIVQIGFMHTHTANRTNERTNIHSFQNPSILFWNFNFDRIFTFYENITNESTACSECLRCTYCERLNALATVLLQFQFEQDFHARNFHEFKSRSQWMKN